nr:hypothetical protein GCM10020241_36060 [Streptoalloteichus tenebrarius]
MSARVIWDEERPHPLGVDRMAQRVTAGVLVGAVALAGPSAGGPAPTRPRHPANREDRRVGWIRTGTSPGCGESSSETIRSPASSSWSSTARSWASCPLVFG